MFFRGFPGFNSGQEQDEAPKDVDNKEFYEILEISKDANQDEIKKAYRTKVIKAHPDKGGDPEEFKRLQAAYEVISHPEKREIYDKYGIDGLRQDGGGGMDPFEGLFGGLFGGHGGGGKTQKEHRKVKPTVKDITVTLEEIYVGRMHSISFDRQRNCEECDGKGGKDVKKCSTCKGAGAVEKVIQIAPGFMTATRAACHKCKGEGMIIEKENICKVCKGDKVKKETKTMDIPVEQGAPDGATVNFSGEGNEIPDAMAGDLIVRLIIEPHKTFLRKGADLYYKKKISLYEALTGCAFYIEHLDGKKFLVATTPGEITTPGAIKQLHNKGMPFYKDAMSHGNLYVNFDVEFPKPNELKNIEGLKKVLPIPKDLITNIDKTKCEILEDFDSDGLNSHAEGGKGRKGEDDEDDEDNPGGRGQRVQCAQQ
jgi:DnaJ family protein A protein 2